MFLFGCVLMWFGVMFVCVGVVPVLLWLLCFVLFRCVVFVLCVFVVLFCLGLFVFGYGLLCVVVVFC